jgi:hypothetical protein
MDERSYRMSEQERSAALQRLDAFVGKWNVELVFPTDPTFKAQTQASFEWLDDRRFFLVYRAGTEGSGYPVGHCIIGGDDTMETYTMLYSDSRGVARLYQMSLRDGVWRQWRDDPSFRQRFSATFSEDGRTIKGQWEKSEDGVNWEHDFDLTYIKVAD